MNDRVILHCDMNGFYASVELLDHPGLAGRPMAVCGAPENRHGIILAKNELAKRAGVVTAETLWSAMKKCPGLVTVRPHHEKYRHYSKLINKIYERYTDMIEPFSIDESWLDVSGSLMLFGDGVKIADDIRNTVRSEFGLTLSVGVSYNKIFAKMGSEHKKPDATTLISRSNYRDILWPKPAAELFFVGKAAAGKLNQIGIRTIGDLAVADMKSLTALLGKQGLLIRDYANGDDQSPVLRSYERQKIKSIGNGITFKRDLRGESDIRTALTGLSDKVAGRLRKYEMKACGIKVDIRDPDFNTISRQSQLGSPTDLAEEIMRAARELVKRNWNFRDPVRMLTVTGINLVRGETEDQISFFDRDDGSREKTKSIESAIDSIRAKYGGGAIAYGSMIKNDLGLSLEEYSEDEFEPMDM